MNSQADIWIPGFCGFGLHLKLDGFRLVYVAMAVLMWAASGVFSREYMAHYQNKKQYYFFFWITFLATAGVFLSADLYTTFLFFEIMSFTSFVWVIFEQKKEAISAAKTYLAVAVIGGMVMLMGLFLLYDLLGTLEIEELRAAAGMAAAEGKLARLYGAGGLLLFGFGAKAGCFPLHIWLPKAHPVAPAPASALLSGILTKTGVFGMIVVSCQIFGFDRAWGLIVTGLGLITMFLGALLAMFSVNLKRTLACSSVSQIGFILTGIGMCGMLAAAGANPSIAARGAFLHMVNHSLFKLILFLCAGAVFMNLHQLDLNEIQGYGRKRPLLAACFLTGALGISGVPLWSGYISKTLLHECIAEYQELIAEGAVDLMFSAKTAGTGTVVPIFAGKAIENFQRVGWAEFMAQNPVLWTVAEWVFLITGGMTVSYMMKLFIAVFVEKHPKRQEEFDRTAGKDISKSSSLVLGALAVIIVILGMLPHWTMDKIADMGQEFFGVIGTSHIIHYFSLGNLKGSMISIGIGVFLYVAVIRRLLARPVGEGKEKRLCYLDRWPAGLDLEEMVYRPVLLVFLPGVWGAVFGFIDRNLIPVLLRIFFAVASVVCRTMDHLADGIVVLARRTTHRQLWEKEHRKEKDRLAQWIGRCLDRLPKTMAKKGKEGKKRLPKGQPSDRVLWLMQKEEEFLRTGHMVEESFSFGLMLFCIGLCLTLGYLLFEFFTV